MKGILCLDCVDFRALNPVEGVTVTCNCGNVTGTWTNAERGWAKVKAKYSKATARIIGIHNGFLALALQSQSNSEWRLETQQLLDSADGYLFHTKMRNSPFVIIRIGESNDVVWWEDYDDV